MPTFRVSILPLALFLIGCGRTNDSPPRVEPKSDPAPEVVATEKAPPQESAPSPPETPAAWTQDARAMRFPAAPVAGKLNGQPFTPAVAELSRIGGRFLTLLQGDEFNPDLQVKVLLSPAKGETFSGKTYEVMPDAASSPLPVSVSWKGAERQPPEGKTFSEKLALRLEFGQEKGGKLPGKIFLCLPDEAKSFVAGTFTADVEPDLAAPVRIDELPCVGGKITVKGPDELNLVAGFVGLTKDGTPVSNLAGTIVSLKAETSVFSAPFPPQRSTLVNDLAAGCLYRHERLAPGRYMLFVGTGDRYVDWRWVVVKDDMPLAVDFSIEPNTAGTLEVVLPKGVTEGVRLIPRDEDGKVPDVKDALGAMSLALKTDVPAKDGKVTLDGLRPGAYRLIAGAVARDVTVRPNETVTADLSAP